MFKLPLLILSGLLGFSMTSCSDKKSGGGSSEPSCKEAEPASEEPSEETPLLLTFKGKIFGLAEPGDDPTAEAPAAEIEECNVLVSSTEGSKVEKPVVEEEKPVEEEPVEEEAVTLVIPVLGAFSITGPSATTDHPNPLLTFSASENAAVFFAELCGPVACQSFTIDPVLHKDGKSFPTLQNGIYTITMSALGIFGQELAATNSTTASPYTFTVGSTDRVGSWAPFDPFGTFAPRSDPLAFWTGTSGQTSNQNKMLVWGGADALNPLNSGGIFNSANETWIPTSTIDAPSGRVTSGVFAPDPDGAGSAVGAMIVWGGSNYKNKTTNAVDTVYADGGILDFEVAAAATTGRWTAITTTDAPTARWRHSSVWTTATAGKAAEMIIWGGITKALVTDLSEFTNQGYALDPGLSGTPGSFASTWRSISTTGAPSARSFHAAVWDEGRKQMIIWGGLGPKDGALTTLGDGAIYNKEADSWTAMQTVGAPGPRYGFAYAVSSGHFFVWGGVDKTALSDGYKYDLATMTWTKITDTNVPASKFGPNLAVTDPNDDKVYIWGGLNAADSFFYDSGSIYDIGDDSWTTMNMPLAPSGRYGHAGVWDETSNRLIIYGGDNISGPMGPNSRVLGDGAIYTP